MVQKKSGSESCKALFFFATSTRFIVEEKPGSINPPEGQALMRRKEQRCCGAEVIPDETGSCPGLTSRPNRSTVGHRYKRRRVFEARKAFSFSPQTKQRLK